MLDDVNIMNPLEIMSEMKEIQKNIKSGIPEEFFAKRIEDLKNSLEVKSFYSMAENSFIPLKGVKRILPVECPALSDGDKAFPIRTYMIEPIGFFLSRLPIGKADRQYELEFLKDLYSPFIEENFKDREVISQIEESTLNFLKDLEEKYGLDILSNFSVLITPNEVLKVELSPKGKES